MAQNPGVLVLLLLLLGVDLLLIEENVHGVVGIEKDIAALPDLGHVG